MFLTVGRHHFKMQIEVYIPKTYIARKLLINKELMLIIFIRILNIN